MDDKYVIGVDYGTASVRSILVNAHNGTIVAEAEYEYPRWKKGLYCNPSKNQFRQHPMDYLEGLEFTIKNLVGNVSKGIIQNVKAITIDTTGSTPGPVDKTGTPLALKDEFKDNPNAMFFLWKDHTAKKEADEINNHAKIFETNYIQYSGGIYSSEWFWAKLLYTLRTDTKVSNDMVTWLEHCDWMSFLLTGGTDYKNIKRSVCAAGHKALWSEEHGGLPPEEFFTSLDPLFRNLEHPLFSETYTSDTVAGNLCAKWALKLGLDENVKVGVGALDAHLGAVGGQIEPYYLSKVMGTSTCDMLVIPKSDKKQILVPGISGQVDGSIVPGMIGFEAGQSAFGDVYDWFKQLLTKTIFDYILKSDLDDEVKQQLIKYIETNILMDLSEAAKRLPFNPYSELALDWFNGRRTPNANPYLKAGIFNLDLASDAPNIFRSLVETTCFGSKKIVEHFIEKGIPIKGIIAVGGVARKSDFVMQTMADVIGVPIKVNKAKQSCALGSAMFATVVAGIYDDVETAASFLGQGFDKIYKPDLESTKLYNERYRAYQQMGDFLEAKIIISKGCGYPNIFLMTNIESKLKKQMKQIEPFSKQKKITNFILCVVFIIFALLQLNDPDSFLWFSIYFIVSIIFLYSNFKPISKSLLILIIIALLAYSAFYFPLFIDYLETKNKEEIFDEMVYDKPYLEGAREFIGLLIAAIGVIYQLKIRKNRNQ